MISPDQKKFNMALQSLRVARDFVRAGEYAAAIRQSERANALLTELIGKAKA